VRLLGVLYWFACIDNGEEIGDVHVKVLERGIIEHGVHGAGGVCVGYGIWDM